MLRIAGFESANIEVFESTESTPFSVDWDRHICGGLYWMGHGGRNELIEIGIHGQTGRILAITIESGPILRSAAPINPTRLPIQFGSPVCDLSSWGANTYIADKLDLICEADDHSVRITFDSREFAVSILCAGHTRFLLGQFGDLVAIEMINLPSYILERLREHLEST